MVVTCLIYCPEKANGAQEQHQHNWTAGLPIPKPIIMLFYPNTTSALTYLRCYEIATLADIASDTDWDKCTAPGCPYPDGRAADEKVRKKWSDNGANGQFGTIDNYGNFVPLDPVANAQQITHYRAAWNNPGIVHITLVMDDLGLYYDDEPVSNDATNGNVTVWEFWVTPCPQNWRPSLFLYGGATQGPSFTAWVEPSKDHYGQLMSGVITFSIFSSTEPGECLNRHHFCPYAPGMHDDDLDLQFPNQLQGFRVSGESGEYVDENGNIISYQHNFYMAETEQPVIEATVSTLCFDGGAYGFLSAEIRGFPPGSAFARRTDTGIIGPVDIPYDDNENYIADCWERALGIYPANAQADFDNTPQGDGTPGDGLSVYKEYRGLMVRRSWTVFNPWLKDMFVMNFGAGNEATGEPPTIPNEAITSQDGFPGAGMPILWLLNANEGDGYPHRVVNFLHGYAHNRNVYAAIVVPGDVDNNPATRGAYGVTYGPIWGNPTAPIIEIDLENINEGMGLPCNDCNQANNRVTCSECIDIQQPFQHCGHCQTFLYCCDCDNDRPDDEQQCGECGWNIHNLAQLQFLTWIVGHELGHTVLWHQPGGGHHEGATTYDCLIWQWVDWRVNPPTEFCAQNPGCQTRWKLNP